MAPALLLACAAPSPPREGVAAPQPAPSSTSLPAQTSPRPWALPTPRAAGQAEAPAPLHLRRRLVLGRVVAVAASEQAPGPAADALAHLAQALTATDQFTVDVRSDLDFEGAEATAAGLPGSPGPGSSGPGSSGPGTSPANALAATRVALAGVDALLVGRLEIWPAPAQTPGAAAEPPAGMSATARFVLRALDPRSGESIVAISALRQAPTREEALAQAATEVARALAARLAELPWQAALIRLDGDRVRLSAGEAQGLPVGTELEVQTLGDRVRSRRSGLLITLPGQRIARLRVDGNASARLIQGSLAGLGLEGLVARLPPPGGAAAGFSELPDPVPLPSQPTRTSP